MHEHNPSTIVQMAQQATRGPGFNPFLDSMRLCFHIKSYFKILLGRVKVFFWGFSKEELFYFL